MHRHTMIGIFAAVAAGIAATVPWPPGGATVLAGLTVAFVATGLAVAVADLRWALIERRPEPTDADPQHSSGRVAAV
jgi:phage shock protein PspC (stress-responsive transcriptional regulator)